MLKFKKLEIDSTKNHRDSDSFDVSLKKTFQSVNSTGTPENTTEKIFKRAG